MPGPQRIDPFENFRFRVEIDGIQQAAFTECSGLGSHIDVVEHRDGAETMIKKLPGLVKYPDIVLKWGITASRELYDWHRRIINGQLVRKSGSVIRGKPAGDPAVCRGRLGWYRGSLILRLPQ